MKRILTILLLLMAVACNKKLKVPENLIQPEQMETIMIDLINVDGRIANASYTDSTIRQLDNRYRFYQQVFQLHGTDKEKFTESLKFYEQHPPLLKDVLENMDKELARQLADTTRRKKNMRPMAL